MEHVQEKVLIGKMLLQSSAKGAEKLDAFSGWMLGAYAAVLAFLLGKIGDLADYLSAPTLPMLVRLFLAAMVAAIIAKFASLILNALSGGGEAGEKAFASMNGVDFDIEAFFTELDKSAWGWNRLGTRWAVKRLRQGDFACSGRVAVKLLHVQSVATMAQSMVTLWAVWTLYRGLVI
ncbi:hypothetical protein [Cupriavidus phytorum]|nr:hypothetical protein [Cupriavidus alkaliphilus]